MSSLRTLLIISLALLASCLSVDLRAQSADKRRVRVYFASDKRGDCSQKNIFCLKPVSREARISSPARDALNALIQGPTPEETSAGLYSPYTNDLIIDELTIAKGIARVSFRSKDPTVPRWPGDLAPATFRAAIEQTLKQFPTVRSVIICLDGFSDFDDERDGPKMKCH